LKHSKKMNKDVQTQIIINNFNSELKKINLFIKKLGKFYNIKEKIISHIQLALEELIVNIISYSYEDQEVHKIQLKAELNQNNLILYLINRGRAFNPIARKNTDIHKNLKERKIGGLGISLTKNVVDNMSYSYQNGYNQVIIIKSLSGG